MKKRTGSIRGGWRAMEKEEETGESNNCNRTKRGKKREEGF